MCDNLITMQILESTLKVKKSDLDDLNHVNNVHYVQWVQDIAKGHWTQVATKEILDHYFWVMINHCIAYKNSALLNDTIHIKTYIKNSKGPISTRIVEITNHKTNLLLATSETKWCLINKKTNRPTRITSEIIGLFS